MAIHGTYTDTDHANLIANTTLRRVLRVPSSATKAHLVAHWGTLDDLILTERSLTSLSGLEWVTGIDGTLDLSRNRLSNVNELSLLASIGGNLLFVSSAISDVSGLSSLVSVGGDFIIQDNYNLSNLSGMSVLDTVSGNFIVDYCRGLELISGLELLDIVGKDFIITDCNKLVEVTGLDILSDVGESLRLVNCQALSHINHLGTLVNIGGSLSIVNCDSLSDLSGISREIVIGNTFNISIQDLNTVASLGELPAIQFRSGYTGSDALESSGYSLLLLQHDEQYPLGRLLTSAGDYSSDRTAQILSQMISSMEINLYNASTVENTIALLERSVRVEIYNDLVLAGNNSSGSLRENIRDLATRVLGTIQVTI